jgi:hypothetical protein
MAGKPTVGKVRRLKTKEEKEREEKRKKAKAAAEKKRREREALPRGTNKNTKSLLIRSRKGE